MYQMMYLVIYNTILIVITHGLLSGLNWALHLLTTLYIALYAQWKTNILLLVCLYHIGHCKLSDLKGYTTKIFHEPLFNILTFCSLFEVQFY